MKYKLLTILFSVSFLFSCFKEEEFDNSQVGNFEALWQIIDEHYCFFEYKNIDWNAIHDKYAVRVTDDMTTDAYFSLLCEMLAELQDGHVNLVASHDIGRYWSWFENYPDNFDEKIQKNYLGTDYMIASGLKYKILDDNIGYIYYESFSSGIGDGNLSQVISRLSVCDGIIIDVRNNGGGQLTNVDKLVGRFINEKMHVGYILHKTGKGHYDFSEPYARYIEPYAGIRYQKNVAVLTNRSSYSATNDFVNAMTYVPTAVIVGDSTGGGSGLPFSSELPNGWSVRFSASPMLNVNKEHTEFGIAPDVRVDMSFDDIGKGIDTIIERARAILKSRKTNR
ncbi:MAG: S41 family peptidase [Dysgonomonas sp.]